MRSERKHTVSICVGTGSFLDNPANPGKAEQDRTGKPAQHERYLVCYHKECKEPTWQRRCWVLVIIKMGLTLPFSLLQVQWHVEYKYSQ